MTSRPAAGKLAASLRVSMTTDEAREVLGFPPGYAPTNAELTKAVRLLAMKAHPDQGGTHQSMVVINIAKEVLEGTRVNDRTEVGGDAKQRRLDLATIERARAETAAALAPVAGRANAILFPNWRLDLREWLIETYAGQLSEMQDLSDKAASTAAPDDLRVSPRRSEPPH